MSKMANCCMDSKQQITDNSRLPVQDQKAVCITTRAGIRPSALPGFQHKNVLPVCMEQKLPEIYE